VYLCCCCRLGGTCALIGLSYTLWKWHHKRKALQVGGWAQQTGRAGGEGGGGGGKGGGGEGKRGGGGGGGGGGGADRGVGAWRKGGRGEGCKIIAGRAALRLMLSLASL